MVESTPAPVNPTPGQQSQGTVSVADLEELKRRNSELESKLVQVIDRSNRAEQLVQAYMKNTPSASAPATNPNPYAGLGIDASKLFNEPEVVLEHVYKKAVNDATDIMNRRWVEAEQLKSKSLNLKENFYKTNPDLQGFEDLVSIAENEIRLQYPQTPFESLLGEIAKKSREKVLELKNRFASKPPEQPLSLEHSTPSTPSAPSTPDAPETPEKAFVDYLGERRAWSHKTTGQGLK